MPIGIIGSLFICTILYILVAGVLTTLSVRDVNIEAPIAQAFLAADSLVLLTYFAGSALSLVLLR